MSEVPTTTETPTKAKRNPLKPRHESLGYFFGQPLVSFENLLQPAQPSTSTPAANQGKIKPTDRDIVCHWIYLEDQNGKSNSNIGIVADNLLVFYTKYHPSVELR